MSLARIIIDNCTGIGQTGIKLEDVEYVELSNSTAQGESIGMLINENVTDSKFTNLTIKSFGISADGAIISSGANNIFDNLVFIGGRNGIVLYDSVSISNSGIYSGSDAVNIISTGARLINSTIYSATDNGIDLNGYNDCSIINCTIEVGDNTKNCIHSGSAVNTSYTKNVLSGATVAINANVSQAIIATEDNQGNIII